MPTIKRTVAEIINPPRRNDLEARRRKLGLSRVALGRILGVDPATVFRREREALVPLWDYAMRGIEAEASEAKPILRSSKRGLKLETVDSDRMASSGFAFTAEKMNQARLQHAQQTAAPSKPPRKSLSAGQSEATRRLADKYMPDPARKK